MPIYILIAELVVAVALIAAVLLQVKGGGLGGIFGQADTVYRTRRGMEKSLLILTIVLAVMFVLLAVFAVRMSQTASA
jgi:preprotein translocase subunit SecG